MNNLLIVVSIYGDTFTREEALHVVPVVLFDRCLESIVYLVHLDVSWEVSVENLSENESIG